MLQLKGHCHGLTIKNKEKKKNTLLVLVTSFLRSSRKEERVTSPKTKTSESRVNVIQEI